MIHGVLFIFIFRINSVTEALLCEQIFFESIRSYGVFIRNNRLWICNNKLFIRNSGLLMFIAFYYGLVDSLMTDCETAITVWNP